MSSKFKIRADDTEHEVDLKQLTLVCQAGGMKIDPAEPVVMVDPETTVKVARNVSDELWENLKNDSKFLKLFKLVFTDREPSKHLIGWAGLDELHVVGMILLLWYSKYSYQHAWLRLPETYLHPKYQTGIADMLIAFQEM